MRGSATVAWISFFASLWYLSLTKVNPRGFWALVILSLLLAIVLSTFELAESNMKIKPRE